MVRIDNIKKMKFNRIAENLDITIIGNKSSYFELKYLKLVQPRYKTSMTDCQLVQLSCLYLPMQLNPLSPITWPSVSDHCAQVAPGEEMLTKRKHNFVLTESCTFSAQAHSPNPVEAHSAEIDLLRAQNKLFIIVSLSSAALWLLPWENLRAGNSFLGTLVRRQQLPVDSDNDDVCMSLRDEPALQPAHSNTKLIIGRAPRATLTRPGSTHWWVQLGRLDQVRIGWFYTSWLATSLLGDSEVLVTKVWG